MRSSTLIPWLFFGPFFGALAAGLTAQWTNWVWATWVAQGLTIILILVIIAAFVPNFLWHFRRRSGKSKTPDDPKSP